MDNSIENLQFTKTVFVSISYITVSHNSGYRQNIKLNNYLNILKKQKKKKYNAIRRRR